MTDEQLATGASLVRPARLWSREEVLARPSPGLPDPLAITERLH
jgi:hypothetical protein